MMRIASVVASCLVVCGLVACGGEPGAGIPDGGNGSGSDSDTLPPTIGAAIGFTGVGAERVTVTWGAANDSETAADALQYRLVRGSTTAAIDTLAEAEAVSGADLVLDFTPNTLSAVSDALMPSTTYAFAVIVQDASSNRALYAPATITTLPAPGPTVAISTPAGPTALTAASSIALTGTSTDAASITSVTWANTTTAASGTATGTTSWSVASIPLAIGANTIVVTAKNATNDTGSATIVVTRDAAGPTLQITSPASNVVTAQTATAMSGTAADPAGVASVTWVNTTNNATGSATGTTSWSVASVSLASGSNTVEVTATDTVGNATTVTVTVVRDSDAPTIAIDSPTTAATYTTASSSISVGGTASDTVGLTSVAWANTTTAASGTATGTTSWTVPTIALASGANTIVMTATDTAGNTTTDMLVVERDNTAPAIAITMPTANATLTTAAATVSLVGTATDGVGVASVTWANSTTGTSGAATGTTSWTTAAITLAEGANTIVVTATDTAGNTGTDTLTVTRDNTGPTVTITSPTASPTYATSTSAIALSGTSSDPATVVSVTWTNITTAATGTATGNTSWSVGSIALDPGANTIVVTAVDGVGNTGSDTIVVTRDNTPPQITITSPTSATTLTTAAATIVLGGTALDAVGLSSITWQNATNATTGTATGTTSWTTGAISLAVGGNSLVVTATDLAGNTSTDTITVTRDVDGPTITIVTPTTLATYTTGAATINVTGDASDPAGVASIAWTNSGTGASGTATGTSPSWSIAALALVSGANTIVVTATDSVGNTSTDTIVITRDATGPTVTFTSPNAGPTYTSLLSTIALAGTASDSAGVSQVTWINNANGETATATGTTSWTIAAVDLVTGTNAIDVRATDGFGNVTTKTLTVTKSPTAIVDISAGFSHTCAILVGGTLKCWGTNERGQLGLGDRLARGDARNEMGTNLPAVDLGPGRTATAVATGAIHTCVVLDNGGVKCWGMNDHGQLGLGDGLDRGDDPNELGANLPQVDLGTGRTAIGISAGYAHTCALLDDNTVKCWGDGTSGQLGPTITGSRGDGPNEMGDALTPIPLPRPATQIASTSHRNCALLDNGSVACWGVLFGAVGSGAVGIMSLGTGRTAQAILDSSGAEHFCVLLDDGALKCVGENAYGELGYGDTNDRGDDPGESIGQLPAIALGTGRTATSIAAGNYHSCAILDDDTLKCWGYNPVGQLGVGDAANHGDGASEMGDSLPAVDLGTGLVPIKMVGGRDHTCVMFQGGTVKCWGYGTIGVLSTTGTVVPVGDGANEMGNNLRALDL